MRKKSLLVQMADAFNKWEYSSLFIAWVWAGNAIVCLMAVLHGEGTVWTAVAGGFCFLVACVYWNRYDQRIKK